MSKDGNELFAQTCLELGIDPMNLVVKTARWVDPETFRLLPVWYPEAWRDAPLFDVNWQRRLKNTSKSNGTESDKYESNERAQKALKLSLNYSEPNWTCCHIWGVDDPKFRQTNEIVRNPRFYSCVANMILLPTPLKAFTDSVPEIKTMLRVCAYWLYGWVCDHETSNQLATEIRNGFVPNGYPKTWPCASRKILPEGVVKISPAIRTSISKRIQRIQSDLDNAVMRPNYPLDKVRDALRYWEKQTSFSISRKLD